MIHSIVRLFFLCVFGLNVFASYSQTYPAQNITMLSHVDPQGTVGIGSDGRKYSGCWGWHQSAKGKEYGIVGTSAGTYFIDLTNPSSPVVCDFVGGKTGCTWREMKTYLNYCYIVSDDSSPNRFQIVDLQYLPDSVHVVHDGTTYFERGHTIWIDKDKMYIGSETKLSGNYSSMCVYSLATPTNPTFLRALNTDVPSVFTVHDMYVNNDTVFASCGNQGLFIYKYNATNSFTPLGTFKDYHSAGAYNHSSFMTKDRKHLVFADEVPGSLPLRMLDIQNISNPIQSSTVNAHPETTPHNPYVVESRWAVVSCYMDGLVVYDLANPNNITVAGYFDTHPQGGFNVGNYSGGPYRGNWGAYPYLPSGIVMALDMQNGVFVLDVSQIYTVSPIGVQETIKASPFFNVYPSPATDKLNIMSNFQAETQFTMSNMLGETILNKTFKSFGNQSIDVSALPSGTYIVTLKTSESSLTKKIIINN